MVDGPRRIPPDRRGVGPGAHGRPDRRRPPAARRRAGRTGRAGRHHPDRHRRRHQPQRAGVHPGGRPRAGGHDARADGHHRRLRGDQGLSRRRHRRRRDGPAGG